MNYTCTQSMILTASRTSQELNDSSRQLICDFFASKQAPNGGFMDRAGKKSDLYYTLFAVAGTLSLGEEIIAAPLKEFLDNCEIEQDLDFVHLASLVRCRASLVYLPMARQDLEIPEKNSFMSKLALTVFSSFQSNPADRELRRLAELEKYRSQDGGYHHQAKGAERGSAYAAFMAWLAYQDAGVKLPHPERLLMSLKSLRTADGSYANDVSVKTGSTTSTAAAIALLKEMGENVDEQTVDCLQERAALTGGFLANPKAPLPDLLSTATALYALRRVDYDLSVLKELHQDFITSLWSDDGGFTGHALDRTSDCEYTFYALLALGSLQRKGDKDF